MHTGKQTRRCRYYFYFWLPNIYQKPYATFEYRSGGIALLVKEEILPFINIIKNDSNLLLWFSISKRIMPKNEDLVCAIASKYAHADPYLELQNEFDKFA